MITRLARNLFKKLKDLSVFRGLGSDSPWNCHADIFRMGGRRRMLITNDLTMFTIFIPELQENDFRFLDLVIGQHFVKNLLYENVDQNLIRDVFSECEHMSFRQAYDEQALSSMKILRRKLQYIVRPTRDLDQVDFYELNAKLNRVALKSIGYNRPIDMLKKKLQCVGELAYDQVSCSGKDKAIHTRDSKCSKEVEHTRHME